MAKFNFPMTFDQFVKALKSEGALNALGGDAAFAYSCIRMGWMNKQHHKQSQMRQREMDERIKEALRSDPALRAKLLGGEAGKKI